MNVKVATLHVPGAMEYVKTQMAVLVVHVRKGGYWAKIITAVLVGQIIYTIL